MAGTAIAAHVHQSGDERGQAEQSGGFVSEFFLLQIHSHPFYFFFFFFFFCLFRAASMAFGGSQATGPIGAEATGLCHGHNNSGSEPHW